jgi:branched-chain amino acid transport system permease protein
VLQKLFILFLNPEVRSLSAGYAQANFTIALGDHPLDLPIALALGVVVLAVVHLIISRTTFRQGSARGAEDPMAAAVLGVNVKGVHALTYAVAAAAAAIGGILVGLMFSFSPTSGTTWLITGFAVVGVGWCGQCEGHACGRPDPRGHPERRSHVLRRRLEDLHRLRGVFIVLSMWPQGIFGRGRSQS